MLVGVVSANIHVLETSVSGDLFRVLEAGAGVGDEADAGDHLVPFNYQMIRVSHALHSRRALPELRIDALGPQVGRLEYVGIRRYDEEIIHAALLTPAAATAPRRRWISGSIDALF